jgi:hypothetical protein
VAATAIAIRGAVHLFLRWIIQRLIVCRAERSIAANHGASYPQLTCCSSKHGPVLRRKLRTASGDTLFQLVFMMQTTQDVLNCDPTIARQSMSRVQLRELLRRVGSGVPGPRLECGRPL